LTFLIQYEIRPEHRDSSQARFKQTGGLPPDGAKMIARWHRVGGGGGWVVAETDDSEALGRWTQEWSDLLSFKIIPVIDDETMGKILA
jgi:hypothetical protein